MTADYDVVDAREVAQEKIVSLLRESFGPHKTVEHYRWKHVDGPWGPSHGWAAVDTDELLGLRLMVPWRLRHDGLEYEGSRAMDGAVAPAARGRGVFSTLVRREMKELSTGGRWHVVYSTSVPASREAYRRLGWTILPAWPMLATFRAPWRPARAIPVNPGSVIPDAPPLQLATAWDAQSMAWRVDPRSGRHYRALALDTPDSDCRLLYHVTSRRGVRLLVATALRGSGGDRGALLSAALAKELCVAVAAPATSRLPGRLQRRVGGSTVSCWQAAASAAPPAATDPRSWAFTGADLEGVL